MSAFKRCTKCRKEKPLDEFHRNRGGKYGRQSQCRGCKRIYQRAWYVRNREHCIAYNLEYHKKNGAATRERHRRWYREAGLASVLIKAARQRACKLNLPFNLTKDWLQQRIDAGQCELTGIPFQHAKFGHHPFALSIDRRVPEKGYTKRNCRVVLFALNVAMRDWGLKPTLKIARELVKRYG